MLPVAITSAALIVIVGSSIWEFRRKGETVARKAYWWVSLVVGLSGVLYGAYVSVTTLRFFPIDRIVLGSVLGVALGVISLSMVLKRARSLGR